MKKNSFSKLNIIATRVSIFVFFTAAILQFGCGSNNDPANKPILLSSEGDKPSLTKNWINASIKFKPNTNSEMRAMTFKAIEKLVLDSVQSIRAGKNPEYAPKFSIGYTFGDTLAYEFRVEQAAKDTVPKPPCTCGTNCGICLMITTNVDNSKSDTSQVASPYRHISSILFRPE